MASFKDVIKELKITLRKILLFDIFIESLLIFLCLSIFLMIFNISFIFSIVPSIFYFFFMVYKRKNLTSIKTVENKYPILHEALRTANDTISEDNYLVNELREQVRNKVKNVSASTFIDIKGDLLKITLSIGLIFLLLSLSICKGTSDTCRKVFEKTDIKANIDKLDFKDIYSQFNKDEVRAFDIRGVPTADKYDVNARQVILDDESMANLGDDKIKIQIKLANDQIDIRDVSDDVTKKNFMGMDIGEIDIATDVSFEEDISKEHKEIVKNYFDSINK